MNTEVRLNIERRMSFADGAPFGDAGPYERLVGSVSFALDPDDPRNANVVDLSLAPRNTNGSVEFRADLDILKPVDLNRGNGRLLYDVNNRGNKTALRAFNDAPAGNDPQTLAAAGNGFLMRQGFTIVWSGWQGDLVAGDGLLTVDLPEALEDGKSLFEARYARSSSPSRRRCRCRSAGPRASTLTLRSIARLHTRR